MKFASFSGPRFPVVQVRHNDAMFFAPSDNTFAEAQHVEGVPLGLVRGRTLWPDWEGAKGETRQPVCISNDMTLGWADGHRFAEELGAAMPQEQPSRLRKIACVACPFSRWQGRKPPRCQIRWHVPMLPNAELARLQSGQGRELRAWVVSFSGSTVKPLEKWLSIFRDNRTPLYVNRAVFSLKRGAVAGRYIAELTVEQRESTQEWLRPTFSALLAEVRDNLTVDPGWGHVTCGSDRPSGLQGAVIPLGGVSPQGSGYHRGGYVSPPGAIGAPLTPVAPQARFTFVPPDSPTTPPDNPPETA